MLEIELQGHAHTLRHAAHALFDRYLGDVLGEDLDDHLWRFEPVGQRVAQGAEYDDDIDDRLGLISVN